MYFSNKTAFHPIFLFLFLSLLFLLKPPRTSAQETHSTPFEYLSPRPGAAYILPEQVIAFRLKDRCLPDLLLQTQYEIKGSRSGPVSATLRLASDRQTAFLTPGMSFSRDEKVTVTIRFAEVLNLPDFSFSFFTTTLSRAERRMVLSAQRDKEIFQNSVPENTTVSISNPDLVYKK
jgi:hypothetical protein